MARPARIELYFKSATELTSRVREHRDHGVHAYNLVNKRKDKRILDWIRAVDEGSHFCLKFNTVAAGQGGADAMFRCFSDFMDDVATAGVQLEVLLISGCGSTAPLEIVECLHRWASHQAFARSLVRTARERDAARRDAARAVEERRRSEEALRALHADFDSLQAELQRRRAQEDMAHPEDAAEQVGEEASAASADGAGDDAPAEREQAKQ